MAAVLLRLFFVLRLPVIAGDSLVYGDIAKCLINNHMFGMEKASGWEPTLIRLPGYPFFLAFTFMIWGQDHYIGAMLMQLVFDVLTCFLGADIARRVVGGRAAQTAFLLAAFCPFLINYAATPLTECLEIFCIAAATDCAVVALDARLLRWWTLCGVACAGAILLRPDGGLILISIGLAVLLRGLGEPGRRRQKLVAASALAEQMMAAVLDDLKPAPGEQVLLLVNGFGGTPSMELYLMYGAARRILGRRNVNVARSLVGTYVTSLEMAGCSFSVARLDDEMVRLWDAPVHTAALRWGA